jgi:molybdate transport system regulatory protein
VNAEVLLLLPGGTEITSVITKGSVESLGLKVGGTAYAVIKSSSVMIGVD